MGEVDGGGVFEGGVCGVVDEGVGSYAYVSALTLDWGEYLDVLMRGMG